MSVDPRSESTAIRIDLGAIFVSMELSRSLWGFVASTAGGTIRSAPSGCDRHYILWLDRLMQQSRSKHI
jgi:hypothetical protein